MILRLVCLIYGPKFTRVLNHREQCSVCYRPRDKHGKRYRW